MCPPPPCTHANRGLLPAFTGDAKLGCRVPLDGYAGVRLLQILELAAYIKGRASRGAVATVLAGDLNSAPDTLEIAVLKVGQCRGSAAPTEPLGSVAGWSE